MADFQQYVFQQGRRVGQIDLSEANAWESLSNTMSNFSNSVVSYQQGVNKQQDAEVKSYINSQEDDIITHIGKLSIDYENDYATFIEEAQAFKKIKMDVMSADEDLGSDFAQGFGQMTDDKIAQYGEKVYAKKVKLDRARQLQTAEDNLETHAIDTGHLIDSAISTYYDQPEFSEDYLKSLGPIFQDQRDTFERKVDGLLELGKSGDAAFKQEQALLGRFYKKAVMAELTANMKEGNGWQTIQDFNADPSKFFNSRPQLQALFPEVKVSMSDEDKNETFKDMMSMLNGYQGQQDRVQNAIASDKLDGQEFFYSNIQSQIADGKPIEKSFLQDWLIEDKLTTKQHDSLLKMIQTGGLYSEDDNVVSGLWDTLFDPTADQFDIYDQIRQAIDSKQITPATQKQMLATLRDGGLKDVTKDEDYQMAINEVKTEFRTTGPLSAFLPNESKNINRAVREIYELKKTLRQDQNFLDEVDLIKAKYKRQPAASTPKIAWSSNWSGTADAPAPDESKSMLAILLESNQITDKDYMEQFNAIDAYMESFNLRKSR